MNDLYSKQSWNKLRSDKPTWAELKDVTSNKPFSALENNHFTLLTNQTSSNLKPPWIEREEGGGRGERKKKLEEEAENNVVCK